MQDVSIAKIEKLRKTRHGIGLKVSMVVKVLELSCRDRQNGNCGSASYRIDMMKNVGRPSFFYLPSSCTVAQNWQASQCMLAFTNFPNVHFKTEKHLYKKNNFICGYFFSNS